MNKKVEFVGIPSGDHECFCWDVTEEVYTALMGEKPSEWDRSNFNEGLYKVYPPVLELPREKAYKFKIEVEEV